MQDPKKKKSRELARELELRVRHLRHKIGKRLINEVARWVSCFERSFKIRTRKITFICDRCSLVNTNYSAKDRSEWERSC